MSEELLQRLRSPASNPLRIHLIGVAGSGMSGLASLLMGMGHRVSGSDRVSTLETDRMRAVGLRFFSPQSVEEVEEVDLVIFSSAIKEGNIAFDAARAKGMAMVRRAEALAAIMKQKRGIVVAGTHGKTTTSSMAAHVLRSGGLKPSHYVGAEIPLLGTNAHWEPGTDLFVAEGDESDGTLALFEPEHAIILNIEAEHLDFYGGIEEIYEVFETLIARTSGFFIYCGDDPGAFQVCSQHERSISYGWNRSCDYAATEVSERNGTTSFRVLRHGKEMGEVELGIPGRHNVLNALGVVALGTETGVSFSVIRAALGTFRGARRRFECKFRSEDYLVYDDYGHHPTEIRATLDTARSLEPKRIQCVFQPHRYSRTKLLREEFGDAFDAADLLYVTDVYPASEKPIPGISGETVCEAVRERGRAEVRSTPSRTAARFEVGNALRPGDLLMSLGAGDVHEVSSAIAQDLEILNRLREALDEEEGLLRLYEPMSRHCTLRIGGPAQFWIEPRTIAGFARLVVHCRKEGLPVRVVGRGSNLLIRDGGIPGVVIHPLKGDFERVDVRGDLIEVGVGARFKRLASAAQSARIGGFEWMEGIPGNVGGGIRMNAGAMGTETFDQVLSVTFIDSEGQLRTKLKEEIVHHYRSVPEFTDNYVVSAVFRGQPADPSAIQAGLDASRGKRKSSQPVAASAGCIFKNPEACGAGQLIDELGLKDMRVGPARVSEVHGNFIVNDGGATAAEALELIGRIQQRAREVRQIELETEVQILGQDDPLLTAGPHFTAHTMIPFQELQIAVLAGGPGTERKVSLASGEAVTEALAPRCARVTMVDVQGADFVLPDGTDLAFNVIHGTFGEDGTLQGLLDARSIPYTGAGAQSSRFAFDKILSKERFRSAGVAVARDEVVDSAEGTPPSLGFPCVVKPPREGSSVGVHIVKTAAEWDAAYEDARQYGDTLLIEEFVEGKELTVGILQDQALPIIHIQPQDGFYDMNNKYPWLNQKGATQYFCPADLPEELSQRIQAEALKAHRSLGIEVYSRVDLLLDEAAERFIVLEVNTIPGMTASSLLPKAARAVGIEFDELCVRIGEESLRLRAVPS